MNGYVYLLYDGEYYKIGITKGDIKKRIKTLQTGSPKPIRLINSYKTKNYRKMESWFHRLYKDDRVEGEWFYLNDDQVNNFTNEAIKIDKNINSLTNNPFF